MGDSKRKLEQDAIVYNCTSIRGPSSNCKCNYKQQRGNNFLHTKGGLHFGIRKYFTVSEGGSGVESFPVGNDVEAPVQQQLIDARKLKFDRPNIDEWRATNLLNDAEYDFLAENMVSAEMTDELESCWEGIVTIFEAVNEDVTANDGGENAAATAAADIDSAEI